jgi:pimeloyl-ACP methyl ester carboxylesterase
LPSVDAIQEMIDLAGDLRAGVLLQKVPPFLSGARMDGPFRTINYAERYTREIPETRFVRIKSTGHIPMENNAQAVAGALSEFFAAERR